MNNIFKSFGILILTLISITSGATNYYVSVDASKKGDGSQASPFNTIQQAADVMKPGDTCFITGGIYEELVVPAKSGTNDAPIVYKSLNKDKVTITGIAAIPADQWTYEGDNIFSCKVKLDLEDENQVFFNEKMIHLARWPNTGDDLFNPTLAKMDMNTSPEVIFDNDLPAYDYTGAEVWVHAPKYWANWTTVVTSANIGLLKIENIAPFSGGPARHVAQPGAEFFVYGIKDALDATNEWYYDEAKQKLYVYQDESWSGAGISFKKRMNAFDLSGKQFINIENLEIVGASIITDTKSSNILLDRLKVFYLYHCSRANDKYGNQTNKGITFLGNNCTIQNSEIAYSSGSGVVLKGSYNKVLNCYIHDIDYIGTYASAVQLVGTGNTISHCTLTRSGRSLITYGGMYKALIQYCDMGDGGLITSDLGLTYGNVIEGGNSEVRYNWLHDNHALDHNMGLYYDHATQNIISHHNVVWGITERALLINHYGYFHLVYNNSFYSSSKDGIAFKSRWGNKYVPDSYGSRFVNNLFSQGKDIASDNYYWGNNLEGFEDLEDYKYLREGSKAIDAGVAIESINDDYEGNAPDLGAYEYGAPKWKVGHDFENPPAIDTTRSRPLHRNLIVNSAFEHDDHQAPWVIEEGSVGKNKLAQTKIQTTLDNATARPGRWSMKLGAKGKLSQIVEGLEPNSTYIFSGHVRVDKGEKVLLGVSDYGGEVVKSEIVKDGSPMWPRVVVKFKTGPNQTSAKVFVQNQGKGKGEVYVDDFGLIYAEQ